MALKQIKLLNIHSISGIATVGILTVGVTETAGGVGIATTTFVSTVIMHNTGLGTCTSSFYIYPHTEENEGVGKTAYRLIRKDLQPDETYVFEQIWPFILTDREKAVVEIIAPKSTVGGTGIGSVVNYTLLGGSD